MEELGSPLLLNTWKQALHQTGFRVTRPRLQVMKIITSSATALTPQEIYQQSLNLDDPPGIASVYRTLEMLEDLDLIQQIHQPDGCHGIWPTVDGHNHHLVCKDCKQMRVIAGSDDIHRYISSIENKTGYRVDEHLLQFFGVCASCQNQNEKSRG